MTEQTINISNEWSFGYDNFSDILKDLVLSGKKTATTGFLKPDTKVPVVGSYNAILDRNGKRFCVIQYASVEVKPFLEVDYEYTKLEGEGDKNIEEWRQKHREYFKKYYNSFTDEDLVVCCKFRLVKTL